GNPGSELDLWARLRNRIERRVPGLDLGRGVRLDQGPDFHDPGRRTWQRQVNGLAVALRCNAAINAREPEHLIDRAKNVLARAERVIEPHEAPRRAGSVEVLLEMLPCSVILARRRALERENRLLVVPDGKHRALPRLVAEFRCQALDNVPLLLAGVLRLIDQDVI